MPCFDLLFALAAAMSAVSQESPGASAATPATALVREELFALELEAPRVAGKDAEPAQVVGVAALRRSAASGGETIEWDLRFFEGDTRVHHVEHLGAAGARLVWREWRPGQGRTLVADVEPTGISLVEWGREEGLRTRVEAPEGMLLPLTLLERARRGELVGERASCFDPLSRSVERLEIAIESAGPSGEDSQERRISTSRADGTSAGSYVFRGEELIEVRWQKGGLRARRIERENYESRLRAAQPPLEASLISR
jgi:hypothetical protein